MPNVPVKPAVLSKINWTQVAGVAASVLALWGIEMTPEEQVTVVSAIQIVAGVLTVAFRTWFTKSVTPSSIK